MGEPVQGYIFPNEGEKTMISVIVPVFNASGSLAVTLDCIKLQTYTDVEVILVDDGSTDVSGRICDEFAREDSRFCVIHKENRGAYSARNAGLDNSRGEWICFVDADDYLHPDALRTLSVGIKDGVRLVAADFRYGTPEEGNPFVGCQPYPEDAPVTDISGFDCLRRMFSRNPKDAVWGMTIWNKLYHRDLVKDSRIRPYKVSEDAFFNFGIFLKTDWCSYVNRTTYSYTQYSSSLSHAAISEAALVQLAVYYDMFSELSLYTGNHHEEIEGMLLGKLYRKLLTSRYHVENNSLLESEWKELFQTITQSTLRRYYHNPFIPLREKTFFSLSRAFPLLMRCYMKVKGN